MFFRTQGLLLSSALALGAISCGGQSKPSNSAPESVANSSSTTSETSASNDTAASPTPSSATSSEPLSDPEARGSGDRMGAGVPSTDPAASDTTASSPNAAALNDQQIAKITDGVNSAEIEQAKLARDKSKNQQVRQFASMMIEHHGQAKKEQAALKVTPEDSPLAQQMAADSASTLETLKSKKGADFDRAYLAPRSRVIKRCSMRCSAIWNRRRGTPS